MRDFSIFTGATSALIAVCIKADIGLWLYVACLLLPLLGVGGGVYYGKRTQVSRSFFLWSLSILSCSTVLGAFVAYKALARIGVMMSLEVTLVTWGVIAGGFYWRVFRNGVNRHPAAVNMKVVNSGAVGGAFLGGLGFLVPPDALIPGVAFLVQLAFGAILVGAFMFLLRDFMDFLQKSRVPPLG
ncbi:hypothetical protein [Massilia genomosp. 1]|uniref:DUF308 domain-containing protein n=1 Tax=Massilia genomosp. 1 TaxID=2609280 RepID=A0ABX0MLE2_9BURK|nr:hypothetical protein [Massilia genomosp. 1]NHZ60725.1 hypothetical protein [Massilia genomosp. 1]